MAEKPVRAVIYYGKEPYMAKATENDILPENVPNAARLLMDNLYLRLDDRVSVAKLRAHRRDLRAKKLSKTQGGAKNGE